MSATLRVSPSGPFLNNANGGGFAPGPGAVLRMNGVHAPNFPASSAANIPSAGAGAPSVAAQVVCFSGVGTGDTMIASLDQPQPSLNYRVTGVLDINSATTAGAIVTMYIDFSNDGVNWDQIASNTHAIGPGAAAPDTRQCRIDMLSQTGAALGVVEGQQSALLVRMRVSSPTPAGSAAAPQVSNPANAQSDPVGTVYMELVEMF